MADFQSNVISHLLGWLENNLDQPLSIDDVAAKSGFSKWHLQRIFKYATGHSLGAYTRARRLSKAAVALRVTNRSILDIGFLYHFDSQQIFTRAFKKQFAQTPALYRHTADWPLIGLCPPIRQNITKVPKPDYIMMPETRLVGVTNSYFGTLEKMDEFFSHDIRTPLWHQYFKKTTSLPPSLYGLNYLVPSEGHKGDMIFYYTTAWKSGQLQDSIREGQPVMLGGGAYAQFTYEGPADGLQNFIIQVYDTAMPILGLTRRQGHDIERYYLLQSKPQCSSPCILHCEYLIPICN